MIQKMRQISTPTRRRGHGGMRRATDGRVCAKAMRGKRRHSKQVSLQSTPGLSIVPRRPGVANNPPLSLTETALRKGRAFTARLKIIPHRKAPEYRRRVTVIVLSDQQHATVAAPGPLTNYPLPAGRSPLPCVQAQPAGGPQISTVYLHPRTVAAPGGVLKDSGRAPKSSADRQFADFSSTFPYVLLRGRGFPIAPAPFIRRAA